MVNYGSLDYWNERYSADDENDEGFDWLCDYEGVKEPLDYLFRDKGVQLLMIGCGNAPFSSDLFKAGYTNMLNIDLSDVVIERMKKRHPEMLWEVMDVLNMSYANDSIPQILDKSLIDTLMCYPDSANKTLEMIRELHRVLQPGGRYVAFSLHSLEEVQAYYERSKGLDWFVNFYRVRSNRWNPEENRNRAVVYTMAVCDKPPLSQAAHDELKNVPGTLNEEQFIELRRMADQAILRYDVKNADIDVLANCLDEALKNVLVKGILPKRAEKEPDRGDPEE